MNPQRKPLQRSDLLMIGFTVSLQAALILGTAVLMTGCERPPVDTTQQGFRGTGMVEVQNPRLEAAASAIPAALPQVPPGGPTAGETYQNVKVLGSLSVGEFTRLMVAMTTWVAPKEGCAYCHDPANMASEEKYTKIVSRRMIEMTQHINANWKSHVADTGVTCYSCHGGHPVPENVWFTQADTSMSTFAGNRAGQNAVSEAVGLASLPHDPFTTFLSQDASAIRVEGTQALPHGNRASIKQAEWTYGLMMNFSKSLGVNCTYCHNSRQFASWEESPPTRAKAWHGIAMARDLNTDYLIPLKDTFPAERRGPTGDSPKVFCGTCHQGQSKPLGGAKMLDAYSALAGPLAAATPAAEAAPAEAMPAEGAPGEPAAEPAAAEAAPGA